MTDEELRLKKRFEELANRAFGSGCYTFTEFLSPAEQTLLSQTVRNVPYELSGGFDGAEKAVAMFGSEEICGYEGAFPFEYVKIESAAGKFSDALSHRDFLGALMSLGIRRSVIGDIIVFENAGYLICLENIADYILENLLSIRHTVVRCSKIEAIPEGAIPVPEEKGFVVASERLDAVVSAIYKLSRSESSVLIEHEKVLINGVAAYSSSVHIPENSIITVRGHGKFIYCGIEHETKKGRLRCNAKIYR